jgi:hypothetical protein
LIRLLTVKIEQIRAIAAAMRRASSHRESDSVGASLQSRNVRMKDRNLMGVVVGAVVGVVVGAIYPIHDLEYYTGHMRGERHLTCISITIHLAIFTR